MGAKLLCESWCQTVILPIGPNFGPMGVETPRFRTFYNQYKSYMLYNAYSIPSFEPDQTDGNAKLN